MTSEAVVPDGARGGEGSRLWPVAATEVRIGIRRFAFWFMVALYIFIGCFYFTKFVNVSAGEDSLTQSIKLARNSAYSLACMLGISAFFFMHFTAALCVDPVLRDRRIGLLPLVLAAPIHRVTYVLGKFIGVAFLALLPSFGFVVACFIAQYIPNANVGLLPPNAIGLAVGYLEFYVPLTLLIAGFVFALAIWSGSPKLVYSVITVIFIGFFTLLNLSDSIDYPWAPYVDPTAVIYLTMVVGKGKTNAELNQIGWMSHGWFLLNRAVILLLGFGLPLLAALRFSRQGARAANLEQRKAGKAKAKAKPVETLSLPGPLAPLAPAVPLRVGGFQQLLRVA
ncbi:MAG TPA: ABC transporter permease, partial [Candidatus Udaeobacter sp.]|nr:ABC transporter permease [Candidatus Udaeobacter sp.]